MSNKKLHCPKCDGTNIMPETAFITGFKYKCKDCGYSGPLVYTLEDE